MRETKYKNHEDLPLTMSVPEVSRAAGYDPVRSQGFPSFKIGNRILVPKDKLLEWIDKQVEGCK